MTFSPRGEIHSNHFYSAGGHCFYLEFSTFALERADEYSFRLNEPADTRSGALTLISRRLYNEFCQADEVSPLIVEGLALEVMAEISRRRVKISDRKSPLWLRQVEELLQARCAEKLTLTEIAALAGVHPVHLTRTFRQFYGHSVGEYVRRLRIERASCELAMLDKPLAEIASAVGFADQAHFTRTFKKQTGLTPARFRRTLSSS